MVSGVWSLSNQPFAQEGGARHGGRNVDRAAFAARSREGHDLESQLDPNREAVQANEGRPGAQCARFSAFGGRTVMSAMLISVGCVTT